MTDRNSVLCLGVRCRLLLPRDSAPKISSKETSTFLDIHATALRCPPTWNKPVDRANQNTIARTTATMKKADDG
ncbi:hypothetical protein RB213_007215 [Colletotrichum asianum]